MIHPETHIVTEHDIHVKLVRKEGVLVAKSFYMCSSCGSTLGEEHKENCYRKQRTVVVQATITAVIRIPEQWSDEDVNRYWTGSRTCANSFIDILKDKPGEECMCGYLTSVHLVREADQEDERAWYGVSPNFLLHSEWG